MIFQSIAIVALTITLILGVIESLGIKFMPAEMADMQIGLALQAQIMVGIAGIGFAILSLGR